MLVRVTSATFFQMLLSIVDMWFSNPYVSYWKKILLNYNIICQSLKVTSMEKKKTAKVNVTKIPSTQNIAQEERKENKKQEFS